MIRVYTPPRTLVPATHRAEEHFDAPSKWPWALFVSLPALLSLGFNTIGHEQTLALSERVTSAAGVAAVTTALCLSAGATAFMMTRKRKAFSWVFASSAALCVLLSARGAWQRHDSLRQHEKQATEQLAMLTGRLEERLRIDIEERGHIDLSQHETAGLVQAIERLNNEASSESGKTARAVLGLAHDLDGASRRYQAALISLEKAEVLNLEGMQDTNEVEDRLALIEEYTRASEELAGFLRLVPEAFASQLRRQGVQPDVEQREITRVRKSYDAAQILAIREADIKIADGMKDVLELLREDWGKWRWNAEAKAIELDDERSRDLYVEHIVRIEEARVEQERLRARL